MRRSVCTTVNWLLKVPRSGFTEDENEREKKGEIRVVVRLTVLVYRRIK